MYGIRSKTSGEFLKLIGYDGFDNDYSLDFTSRIELNYYCNDSLGFICDILLRRNGGKFYCPNLASNIDQNSLEVVNLKSNDIVSIEELLDGSDCDCLPAFEFPIKSKKDQIEITGR